MMSFVVIPQAYASSPSGTNLLCGGRQARRAELVGIALRAPERGRERVERRSGAGLDLEHGVLLPAHGPPVDDRDRDAAIDGSAQETVAGVDRERRADDEKKARSVEGGERLVDRGVWHVVTEEDDTRLEHTTALCAGRDLEALHSVGSRVGVSVRRDHDGLRSPPWIERENAGLKGVAVLDRAAHEALHLGQGAMQFGDPAAPGLVVKSVNVLRDDASHHTAALERCERAMPGVRFGKAHTLPAE